ncbi:MAG: hypothetical protein II290_03820 [Oscillospiraceae bacterium]|nr:hypothetical protein [Oscillospiraceae bacterium]
MMNKRIRAWLLCVLMIGSLLLMCACKSDDNGPSTSAGDGEVTYKVTVVDGVGAPYTEKLIVKFLQNGEQVAMIPIGKDGSVEKTMAAGEYTVEVASTDAAQKFYYDTAAAKVTADIPQIQILLAKEVGDVFETISAPSVTGGEYATFDAPYLAMGTTHVPVAGNERNYFLIAPSEAGAYEISVVGGGVTLGIYGGNIHFVMESSTVEMKDDKLCVSVQPSMIGSGETGTTVYVLGIDVPEGRTDALVNVVRVGPPEWSFEEEPWSDYQPSAQIKDFTLEEGVVLKEFDLTAATSGYPLVYDESIGQYRVGTLEGPRAYAQLGKAVNGVSLMAMVGEIVYRDGVVMQTGSAPFRYSYNNGKEDFFKEDYTDAMREYVTARDKTSGVYPLNKDLHYMISMGVQNNGWCNETSANFLFRDLEGFNPEIGWMFLLVHEDLPIPTVEPTDPTEPSTDPTDVVTDPTDITTIPSDPVTVPTTEPTQPTQPKPTEPVACAHQYGDATCLTGKVCKLCGETSGKGTGHDFSAKGKCKKCNGMVVEDNKDAPTEITSKLEFEVDVKPGHMQYFNIMRVSGTTLKVKGENAFVIYKKKIYKAEDGVVKVPNLQSDSILVPVELAIGNNGPDDLKTTVTMSYPAGSSMNPRKLKMGQFTTDISAGNDQGVYYRYTAPSKGTITLVLDKVSNDSNVCLTLENKNTSHQERIQRVEGDTISIEVEAGDVIEVVIGTLPDKNNKYPAATVTTTASFD